MSENKKTAFMGAPVARLVDGEWEVDENPPVCVLCKRSGCKWARETRPSGVFDCLVNAPIVIKIYYRLFSDDLDVVNLLAKDNFATVRYAATRNSHLWGASLDEYDFDFMLEHERYEFATVPEYVNIDLIDVISVIAKNGEEFIGDTPYREDVYCNIDENTHADYDKEFEQMEDRFIDDTIAYEDEKYKARCG
jgi:hypothetical protein